MAPEPRAAVANSVRRASEAPKEPQAGWRARSGPPWGRRLQKYVSECICKTYLFIRTNTYLIHVIRHTNTTAAVMYWYWYVSWLVYQWKHTNTDHNTYQYHRYISAAGVKTNPYWYVLWYVLVCFQNLFDTRVFGEHRWYWYVLGTYLHVFWYVLTRILWFCICSARIGLYWSCLLYTSDAADE